MMNGSIIVCSNIHITTTQTTFELDLRGVFTGRLAGKPFDFDVYGWWAPEKLGSHACLLTWRHQEAPHTVEPKYLHYHDIKIDAGSIRDHYFGLYFTKIFMPPQEPGNYSVDLVIDGVIVASHPIKIFTKEVP